MDSARILVRASLLLAALSCGVVLLGPGWSDVLAMASPQRVVDLRGPAALVLTVLQCALCLLCAWTALALALCTALALGGRPVNESGCRWLLPESARRWLMLAIGAGTVALSACGTPASQPAVQPSPTPQYAASSEVFDWPAEAQPPVGQDGDQAASPSGSAPSGPVDPASPDVPANPADPSSPSSPSDSIGPANPADPSASSTPSAPSDSTDPTSPTSPSDSAKTSTNPPADEAGGPTATAPAGGGSLLTVATGDCLWSIAEDLLPADAPLADVAYLVDALYAANSDAIGPDPDQLNAGLSLTIPAHPLLEEAK